MNTQRKSSTSSGHHFMLLSVLLFAFGHAAVKWVAHIPFYQLVFLRSVITFILCVVIIGAKGISFRGKNLRLLFYRGFAGTIALTAYFYSLQNMPFASAVSIQHMSPLLTLLIAHFFLNEKSTARQGLFFVIAFIGVLCVKGFDTRISFFALTISVISVVASAIAYNLVRISKDYDNEWVVVLYYPLVTMPLVAPFAYEGWVSPAATDWVYILMIGIFTLLAQIYMTKSYHRARANEVAIYSNLGILIAVAIGYFFFNETLSPLAIFGMVLIVSSVFLSGHRKP